MIKVKQVNVLIERSVELPIPAKMDFEELPYTSCIQIGRRPIIPPVMTNERRAEMRYYRELATTLEKHLKLRKKRCRSIDSGVVISNSDSSIGRKAAEIDQSNLIDVNDSPTAKSDSFTDMNEDSPSSTKSGILIVMNESSSTDGSINEHDAPTRRRRNSYTLETPSPIMLQYMKANEKYDELLIDMMDSSDSSTVVNEEIPISTPIEEISVDDGISLQTGRLTLQDLEKTSEPNSSENWNMDECSFGCPDIEEFVTNARRLKAFSLPSTFSTSPPVCPPKTSVSDHCLRVEYDNLVKNTPAANLPKSDNVLDDYEIHKTDLTSEANDDHFYINDNVNKYVDLLDSSNSANMSFESEIYGRESSYSECSSVSLNKFLVDAKAIDLEESTNLNNYLQLKEQLELKHRNELMKLLREQEKENSLLEQLVRISDTSSPKSNFAYSKEVVLKKYSAENTPSPILSTQSPESRTPRFGGTLNCRRRINNDESGKPNQVDPSGIPIVIVSSPASNGSIQDFEARIRAATKINAAVRGYFVRRLFKTGRVQHLLQTINDCLITAISLQKESDLKPAELSLQSRVLQQSITAQNEIHEIFALPTEKQLEIIAADRDLKNRSQLRKTTTPLPLSEATQKTIKRRKSLSCGSQTPTNVVRKRCKSVSSVRSNSNSKCQNILSKDKTKTNLSRNYSVPHCGRRSWR